MKGPKDEPRGPAPEDRVFEDGIPNPLTAAALGELMDRWVKEGYRHHKELKPAFVGFSENGLHLMRVPFGDFPREFLEDTLREFCTAHNIQAYCVVMEAWIAFLPVPAEGQKPHLGDDLVPPSERPDRKEALVITVVAPDGSLLWSRDIERDAKGNCVALHETDTKDVVPAETYEERPGMNWMGRLLSRPRGMRPH